MTRLRRRMERASHQHLFYCREDEVVDSHLGVGSLGTATSQRSFPSAQSGWSLPRSWLERERGEVAALVAS
ncbi:hypothetical protein M406DRAFT_356453 [Cryphonectria parasitica EP155]|uniref:Uncharacterized protein n=1 Tax=Cryphonectria parasitica (strain ATCC 38755 / EP155) TaxID=660469 RepID=A0A9P4Y0J5_CRYP1|nr:uncharacterized protein M406DRAFT_356453 [Cryphonectria parasitica EP155]KAF3764172.1 hypothetical protein M406DRAFT_356453 [Cryphonectria parasitica EP155]